MKMTYKRWKEINKQIRKPHFTTFNHEKFGITKEELKERNEVQDEYSRIERSRSQRKGCALIFAIFLGIFSIPIGFGLIQNHFQTKALENLTGKNLSYWDVFFAGNVIRANAELQNSKK